jgi:hypothetical protein
MWTRVESFLVGLKNMAPDPTVRVVAVVSRFRVDMFDQTSEETNFGTSLVS